MLLIIHNLPAQIPYKDIKELIATKCGIRDVVLDQLQTEGGGTRVTVGVMEEEDAAMLVRKLNGVYHLGHQLYVEDKRQKRQGEQPYRKGGPMPPSQPQSQVQPQQQYNMQQQLQYDMMQIPTMTMWPNQMPGYMYQGQLNDQAVQNAYMMYGQQYTEAMMAQYSGTTNQYNQQGYGQQGNDRQNDNQQNYDQENYKRQGFNTQSEKSYARRSDNQGGDRNPKQSRWAQEEPRDNRRRPASPEMSAWGQHVHEPKRAKWESDRSERPFERRHRFQEDRQNSSRSTGFDDQKDVKKGWWGKEVDRETHSGRPDERTTSRHDKDTPYRWVKGNERDFQSQRPERRDPAPGPSQADRRGRPAPPSHSDRYEPSERSASPMQENEWELLPPKPMTEEKIMKLLKIKSMRFIMMETIRNIKQDAVFAGRSPLKTAMRRVIIARIDDLVGDAKMKTEEIYSHYRNLYPEQGDALLFSRLWKKNRALGGFKATNMKEFVQTFVLSTGHKSRTQSSYGKSKALWPESQKPQEQMAPKAPAYQMPQKQWPPKGPGNKQQMPGPLVNTKKEFRPNYFTLVKPVTFEIAKNLKLHSEMTVPSVFRSLMRKAILMRVTDIVRGMTSHPDNIVGDYRRKYPPADDAVLLAEARKAIKNNPNITSVDVNEFGMQMVKNPKTVVPPVKPVRVAAPAPAAPSKIPNYPGGDKKLHMQQKRQHKLERTLQKSYDLNGLLQKAVDEELQPIGKLIEKTFADHQTEEEKIIYASVNKPGTVKACMKFLSFHISKRLSNGGIKMARIFGYPKPPKKQDLEAFLSKYKCITLKKSVRSLIYMASFRSFEPIDRLRAMGPIPIGTEGVSITVKYMHVDPVKVRPGVDHWKNLRNKYINSLIDNSRVNLLDKNWQEQEKAEQEARANQLNAALQDAANDVVPVEKEVKDDDINEIEDDDTNIEEKGQAMGVTESDNDGFLHKDFKVIDEIGGDEVGGDEVGGDEVGGDEVGRNEVGGDEEHATNNDNIVDDNWDQTGEDWGDVTENAGDKKIDNGNTVEGDSGPGETNEADDEKAVGEENDADQPDDSADDSAQFAEDIDIADVDFDNIDEDDLEDY